MLRSGIRVILLLHHIHSVLRSTPLHRRLEVLKQPHRVRRVRPAHPVGVPEVAVAVLPVVEVAAEVAAAGKTLLIIGMVQVSFITW